MSDRQYVYFWFFCWAVAGYCTYGMIEFFAIWVIATVLMLPCFVSIFKVLNKLDTLER